MVNWQFYPKSESIPTHLMDCVQVFNKNHKTIESPLNKLSSDSVLKEICEDLQGLGFQVETAKTNTDKIHVPVLFGRNGKLEKYFEADAYHEVNYTVLEVEAGRGVTNYQFLKDLFQACMMNNVEYLIIAVRNIYRTSKDFEKVATFFDTLYASGRIKLPLKGVLIIGY
ncbi:hypothetical protein ABES25_01410 [Bacillus gobiensis]|uniref:hypothetical protein n=1 Tax=Bacillus gobiensis TaxID=1441095 RepID=UPI003D213255